MEMVFLWIFCFILALPQVTAQGSCSEECCDFFSQKQQGCRCFKPMNDADPSRERLCSDKPGKVIYAMKGIPKSGTTWLDVLTINMIMSACPTMNGTATGTCQTVTSPCENMVVPKDKFILHWNGQEKVDYAVCEHNKHQSLAQVGLRTIWIIRDPRDQAISRYYWQGGKGRISTGEASKHISRSIREFKTWHATLRKVRQRDILAFRYEELNQGNKQVLQQIYDFFGISCTVPLTDELAEKIFSFSSLETMKGQEANHTLIDPSRSVHKDGREKKKVRSGMNFGYRNELPPGLVDKYDQQFQRDPILNKMFESYRRNCVVE